MVGKESQVIFLPIPQLFLAPLWRIEDTSYTAFQNPPDLTSLASYALATCLMQASINFLKAGLDGISWKAQTLHFSLSAWSLL